MANPKKADDSSALMDPSATQVIATEPFTPKGVTYDRTKKIWAGDNLVTGTLSDSGTTEIDQQYGLTKEYAEEVVASGLARYVEGEQ